MRAPRLPARLAVALGAGGMLLGCAEPAAPDAAGAPAETASVQAAYADCLRDSLKAGLASLDARLDRQPNDPDALVARGLCYWTRTSDSGDSGDPDDAQHAYRDLSDAIAALEGGAASATPLDQIYSHRAFVAQTLDGAWARTLADLDRAVALAPSEPAHVLDRGVVHAYAGDTVAAVADLRRFLAADSADADRQRVAQALLADLGAERLPHP